MKIFICASKHNYHLLEDIIRQLEDQGHEITPPNSYEDPLKEEELKRLSPEKHITWKANMMRSDKEKIRKNDAVLIMNLEKNDQPNYIGGATFLEIYKAFDLEKKIFLYNPIPDCKLRDEIIGMNPTLINQDLTLIK